MTTPRISTAEHFTDAMNTRRIITQQASSEEHATSLLTLLSLTHDDIITRYSIGARYNDTTQIITFIDGSEAGQSNTGRWHAITDRQEEAAA